MAALPAVLLFAARRIFIEPQSRRATEGSVVSGWFVFLPRRARWAQGIETDLADISLWLGVSVVQNRSSVRIPPPESVADITDIFFWKWAECGRFYGGAQGSGHPRQHGRQGPLPRQYVCRGLWRSPKYEEVCLKAYEDVREAERRIGAYFAWSNTERFHTALDNRTPDAVYYQSVAAAA